MLLGWAMMIDCGKDEEELGEVHFELQRSRKLLHGLFSVLRQTVERCAHVRAVFLLKHAGP